MNKKIRRILLSLTVLVAVLIMPNVKAASHADTNTYYETGRNGGVYAKDSDKVTKNGAIPSEYSFALGNKYDSWSVDGRVAPTDADLNTWEDGVNDNEHRKSIDSTSKAEESIKGNFSITYTNVGSYNGKKIDVKLTVMDFAKSNGNAYNNEVAFAGFYNSNSNRLGVWVGRLDWIEVKYEFFESGTTKPIDLKGYTSYWDIDLYQGIHLLDNNKGLYVSDKSDVKYADINGVAYLYDDSNENYDSSTTQVYNEKGVITETFAGKSMTRVYTFSRPISGKTSMVIRWAQGGIQNEAVINGALKTYSDDTPAGADNTAVKVGDTIKYDIQLTNGGDASANVTITDKLSKGLEYVTGSAKIGETAKEPDSKTVNSDGTTTLVWTTSLAKQSSTDLTYSAKVVSGYENGKVNNEAVAKIGEVEYKLDKLVNPVPTKEYASDTPNGAGGAEVEKGNVIKYSIKYSNPLKEKQKVEITDVISKGIEYKKGTASVNGTSIGDPKVTKNSDGGYTLVWEKEIDAEAVEELTYSVDVTGGVTQVKNNASMRYARMGSDGTYGEYGNKIQLNELINPLKTQPGKIINIPNTASVITVTGIVLGIALIGGGSYLIYRRYKKA